MNEDFRMKEVGMRIRQARKSANLSQEQLAEQLDISTAYMSDIENGKTNLGLKTFMRITEVLKTSADWLLQTDTPLVNSLYRSELNELFIDCTPNELQLYSRIIKDIQLLSRPVG
jgi:transcriptional regulator with XRE-family HTH domain